MVSFPSLLISILAHICVFLTLLISVQFKTKHNILNEHIIDLQLTEYNEKEIKKTKFITEEDLSKSKTFAKKKQTLNNYTDLKNNNNIDGLEIKNNNSFLKKDIRKKEKKDIRKKEKKEINQYDKKLVKFETKNIIAKTLEKRSIFQPNFSENKMSKFSFKNSKFINARNCTLKNKNYNNDMKSAQINILANKEITISALLGNNYYNPKLININSLLNTYQIQYKKQINISDLLLKKNKDKVICN